MTSLSVAADTSFVVAVEDDRDSLHRNGTALAAELAAAPIDLVYFDIVIVEAVNVMGRRAGERKSGRSFDVLTHTIRDLVEAQLIAWVTSETRRWFPAALELTAASDRGLNLNDAFIALACQEAGIRAIVSFDRDFDGVPWLHRIHDEASPATALAAAG